LGVYDHSRKWLVDAEPPYASIDLEESHRCSADDFLCTRLRRYLPSEAAVKDEWLLAPEVAIWKSKPGGSCAFPLAEWFAARLCRLALCQRQVSCRLHAGSRCYQNKKIELREIGVEDAYRAGESVHSLATNAATTGM
jgi:hypothetical protein